MGTFFCQRAVIFRQGSSEAPLKPGDVDHSRSHMNEKHASAIDSLRPNSESTIRQGSLLREGNTRSGKVEMQRESDAGVCDTKSGDRP